MTTTALQSQLIVSYMTFSYTVFYASIMVSDFLCLLNYFQFSVGCETVNLLTVVKISVYFLCVKPIQYTQFSGYINEY